MKKILLFLIMLLFSSYIYANKFYWTSAYGTPTYNLIIFFGCTEGNLTCQNIQLLEINKKNGTCRKFKGKVLTRGKSFTFTGYVFETKDKIRHIYGDNKFYSISKKVKNKYVEELVERIKYLE